MSESELDILFSTEESSEDISEVEEEEIIV